MQIYFGIVENRSDPLELGRCQVRVVGLHTHDKNLLPTSDLPWATPLQPITSAAMNGIGLTPIGPVEGTSVVVTFPDDSMQQPIILGSMGGISTAPLPIDFDDSGPIIPSDSINLVKLRTITGPVTGNKLTFYDPDTGKTDLTGDLKPNMKIVGFGIPEGTSIITIDSSTSITISTIVKDYGENILEFKNPPSNLGALEESKNTIVGSDTTIADKPKATPTNNTIPTVPPPKSVSNYAKAAEGIKALIAACDKVGLTTKEQKCSLLGIAGGESGWIPQLESYNYSPARLKQIYSFATDVDVEKYANAQKRGITREEFFSWVYGPTTRGKGFLGNLTDADGGKYYGRGFIQLTGRANYKRYNDMAQKMGLIIDIVNFPDTMDLDINTSAIIAALYIKDRVPSAVNINAHPGYFYAAKKAVGVNSPDIAAKKLSYYSYFYGEESGGGVVKDAGAANPGEPVVSNTSNPGPSDKSITSGSFGVGFRDPNNKYPLKEYLNEPDVNRLARGIIEGTVVKMKDSTRVLGIPKANGMGRWDQPEAPFGAKYPFNKVFETEAGHIQEFDDTPGQERIHTYHRSGTFTEIDTNGAQVNYIVGDNYILMEKNGCIHVAGECNITVDGNANIFARSDANVEVAANATVTVGNNLAIGSANDTTLAVGGDLLIKAVGDIKMSGANIQSKASGMINSEALGNMNMKSGGVLNQESAGEMNILSGGTMNVDYSEGQFGNGAGSASPVEDFDLTPPPVGTPLNPVIPFDTPPVREFEDRAAIETPEDWDTPEGRAAAATVAREEGVSGAPAPKADEGGEPTTGGVAATSKADCALIYTTKDFTNDYRLSKNFSLGMLIDGGVGGKHRLVAQMLKANANSPERLYTVQEIVCNLAQTAHNVLEPMLEVLPGGIGGYKTQWRINSGYRLKGVVPNESPTSDHCKGHCVDIGILHPDKNNMTYKIIMAAERVITYDQLILEYRHPSSVWIHAGYRTDNNRKMAFTMVNDATFKRNAQGVPSGFFLLSDIPPKGK